MTDVSIFLHVVERLKCQFSVFRLSLGTVILRQVI